MQKYEITQINVFPIKKTEGKLKAFAKIVLDESLMLSSLRVYEGSNGLFVSFPAEQSQKDEEYHHFYYPVSKELKDKIQKEVLAVFESQMQHAA